MTVSSSSYIPPVLDSLGYSKVLYESFHILIILSYPTDLNIAFVMNCKFTMVIAINHRDSPNVYMINPSIHSHSPRSLASPEVKYVGQSYHRTTVRYLTTLYAFRAYLTHMFGPFPPHLKTPHSHFCILSSPTEAPPTVAIMIEQVGSAVAGAPKSLGNSISPQLSCVPHL